jgi:hypothetical protein
MVRIKNQQSIIIQCNDSQQSLIPQRSIKHRLKRKGYVEGVDVSDQKGLRKPAKLSFYSMHPTKESY